MVGFFPQDRRNLWVCWVWNCGIKSMDKISGYPCNASLTRTTLFLLQLLYTEKKCRRQELGKFIEITYWWRWYGHQTEYKSTVLQNLRWWQFLLSCEKIMQIHICIAMYSPEHNENSFSGETWKMRGELITCILWCCDFLKLEKMKTQMNGFDPRKIVKPLSGSHACRERCSESLHLAWLWGHYFSMRVTQTSPRS